MVSKKKDRAKCIKLHTLGITVTVRYSIVSYQKKPINAACQGQVHIENTNHAEC